MSKITDKLFEAIFELIDVRQLLRGTAPGHDFSQEQKEELKKHLKKATDAIKSVEAELK